MPGTMKPATLRLVFRIVFASALALLPPLVAVPIYQPDGPVVWVLAGTAFAAAALFIRNRLTGPLRLAVGFVLGAGYAVAAFILIIYIIVIPFSYYLAWLDLMRGLRAGGIISFLFFAVTAFFSSLLAGLVFRSGFLRPALGLALVILFEAAIVFQTALWAALFALAAVLAVAALALNVKRKKAARLMVPGLLLSGAIGVSALLAAGSPPNSGALTRAALLTDLKRVIVDLFPDLSALSTMAGYGYSFEKADLGRRPILSSVALLKVENPERWPVYLRTQIFDEYFNNNWGVSKYFLDRMGGRTTKLASGRGEEVRRGTVVTVLFDYFPLLPHTLDTITFSLSTPSGLDSATGGPDTGYDLGVPLLKGDVLILQTAPSGGQPETMARLRRLEEVLGVPVGNASPAPQPLAPEALGFYLQLPSSLTERIKRLARSLKSDSAGAPETLTRIGAFLKSNFRYSLNTTVPPKDIEFLDDFLFTTRRGFCAHFATAFVVLARLNGIPARCAAGFIAFPTSSGDRATVTGYNAHVWPEVWLPETGWVGLEATPAFDPTAGAAPDFYRIYNPGEDELTARQLEALMGGTIPVPRRPQRDLLAELAGVLAVLLPWLGGAAGLAFLAFLAIRYARRLARRRFRYAGHLGACHRRLRRLIRRLERRALPPPEAGGWVRWGEALAARRPDQARHIAVLADTANRLFFSRAEAGRRHALYVKRMARRL